MIGYKGKVYSSERAYLAPQRHTNEKRRGKTVKQFSISVNNSHRWIEKLKLHWNISTQKSLTLQAPNISQTEHILAYFLSYIFGDGNIDSFGIRDRNSQNVSISIIGTQNLLNFFKDFCDKFSPHTVKSSVRPERQNSKIYRYTIQGAKVYILAKMFTCLNLDAHVLDRKYNKLLNYIDFVENDIIPDKLITAIQKNLNQKVFDFLGEYNRQIPNKFNP